MFSFVDFVQIESFTVADLPSDMTVYPQDYKLNCTKIGYQYSYNIRIGIDNITLASYTGCVDGCPGILLDRSIYKVRYAVNITWDGMTVSSGSISQSTTGNQMYQCVVAVTNQPNRIRNITIKGNKLNLIFKILYFSTYFCSTKHCSLFSY